MVKNITQMLRDRQSTGKKLNLFKDIYPNREAANRKANRAIRADLESMARRKRMARRWSRITSSQYERVRSSGESSDAYLDYLADRSINAGIRQTRIGRQYDKLVEKAHDILKKHETWRSHYANDVAYRVGNAPQIVAAFNA